MRQRTGYSTVQIGLHWAIAILILAGWLTGEGMGQPLRARLESGQTGLEGGTLHVWLGLAAFALILVRVLVRLVSGAPAAVAGTSELMERAALWGHRLLYLLMLLVPALGMLVWFAGIKPAGELHELAGNALFFVALAHGTVAIWHQFVLGDGVLSRMLRPG